ncbi:MAG: hypothetical protein ACK5O2_04335 [Microthrixaceae bacterium]
MQRRRSERCAATVVAVALIALGAVVMLEAARSGGAIIEAQRASATADAVALAEATGGDEAGDAVASANDAVVSSRRALGPVRVVRVRRAGVGATAAAMGLRR